MLRMAVLISMLAGLVPISLGQETRFPSDNEIRLLVTQADRAVQQYKSLVDEELAEMGKPATDAVAKDRQVIEGLETAIQSFKKNPQGFNSPAGFLFFEWIDDAGRDALLCASSSMSQATEIMVTKKDTAIGLMHLSQGCMDVSGLLYNISENAGSLYERYLKGEQELAEKGMRVSQHCVEALKKQRNQ